MLHDAIVVVIGGSSGMGLGVARSAAALGASVIVTSRSTDRLAEVPARVTEDLRPAAGIASIGPVDALACDLTSEQSVRDLFDQVGRLDHLIITASPGSSGGAFLDTPEAEARGFIDGKLWGAWTASRQAAVRMTPTESSPTESSTGSITFTTGGLAVRPSAGHVPVTVAFAAVEALTRALAVELAPLRVNAIRPGMIDTPMWSSIAEQDRETMFAEFSKAAPAQRVGRPADIGAAAVFLMTATFVTGTILDVSGGSLLS